MELDFRKSPEVLAKIVDITATGIFTVDAKGRFLSWNRAAERITGYSEDEVVGKPCTLLEGANCTGFGGIQELLRHPEPGDGICEQQCKVLAKDGREVFLHGNVCLVRDDAGQIAGAVGAFLDMTPMVQANEKLQVLTALGAHDEPFLDMVGQSQRMREVFRRLQLAADSDVTVLLTGESGTGKELAARAIHTLSARRDQPMISINCSAIPETLLESELFGHVAGSFTGATRDKIGVFVAAEGGTLFLDEIGDVSPSVQVKLLRTLQEREVRRVGDERPTKIDVRLVAATNRDLKSLIQEGQIREDFYYRIRVFEIALPSLRDRREDIPLLAMRFIQELSKRYGKNVDGIAKDAMQLLMDYHWPGNVRELRNAIEHAMVTVTGDRISYLDLPLEVRAWHHGEPIDSPDGLTDKERAERDRIVEALQQTQGNRTKAAKLLGTSRVTLWKKINRYGIEVPSASLFGE